MAHELNELRKLNFTNDIIAYKPQSQFKLGTAAATAIQADSSILGEVDENERQGWLYKSIAANTNFNLYFYGQSVKDVMTLAHLSGVSAVVSIDAISGTSSLPFFVIYTKPDAITPNESWYKSKILGTFKNDSLLYPTEKIQMYLDKVPETQFGYRNIETVKSVEGAALRTEEVWFITLQSDSGAPIGTQILVSDFTYETIHFPNVNRTIKLV